MHACGAAIACIGRKSQGRKGRLLLPATLTLTGQTDTRGLPSGPISLMTTNEASWEWHANDPLSVIDYHYIRRFLGVKL
eukprot:364781-Chlamydomonas_euryale.AAC.17